MAARSIPEAIKREVRQRCFFGCIICGMPLFDYDHFEEWSQVKKHEADNIILLCSMHHDLKSRGIISLERLKNWKDNPFNANQVSTTKRPVGEAPDIEVLLGTNIFRGPCFDQDGNFPVVRINNIAFVALHKEGDWLTLSAILTDLSGRVALVVDRGELVVSTEVWDFRYEGTRLRGWAAKGLLFFDAHLSASTFQLHLGSFIDPRDRTGFLVKDGVALALQDKNLRGMIKGCLGYRNSGGISLTNSAIINPEHLRGGFGYNIAF